MVVPAPLHWMREWRRGFNQSDLLAREIARRTGIPLARPLARVRHTPSQAGLSNTGRRQNVTGAFRCRVEFPAPVCWPGSGFFSSTTS